MKRKQAIKLAIVALTKENQKLAINANLAIMDLNASASMKKDLERYKQNTMAIKTLEQMIHNKQLELL